MGSDRVDERQGLTSLALDENRAVISWLLALAEEPERSRIAQALEQFRVHPENGDESTGQLLSDLAGLIHPAAHRIDEFRKLLYNARGAYEQHWIRAYGDWLREEAARCGHRIREPRVRRSRLESTCTRCEAPIVGVRTLDGPRWRVVLGFRDHMECPGQRLPAPPDVPDPGPELVDAQSYRYATEDDFLEAWREEWFTKQLRPHLIESRRLAIGNGHRLREHPVTRDNAAYSECQYCDMAAFAVTNPLDGRHVFGRATERLCPHAQNS